MEKKSKNSGFSTVELIVSIAIIAVIVGWMVPSLIGQIEKAKEVKALTEARAIYVTAQYAIISAQTETSDSFQYAIKFLQNVNGNEMELGRFSNQSLYKYLKETSGSGSLSSAKSKQTDYYIASQLAGSIPGADEEITESTLKDKSPFGDTHSTLYISQHPEIYGKVVFALTYDSSGKIVTFQCVYSGYFMQLEGSTMVAEKVSDSTKFNDWPKIRKPGADDW